MLPVDALLVAAAVVLPALVHVLAVARHHLKARGAVTDRSPGLQPTLLLAASLRLTQTSLLLLPVLLLSSSSFK